MPTVDLNLSTRTGLPGEISQLRADFPRSVWAAHPNYGGPAAFWLQIHAGLRAEAAAIIDLLETAQADPAAPLAPQFVPALNRFLHHLEGHHQIEDTHYFPRFRRVDPRISAAIDVLESDHRLIHEGLDRLVTSARVLLAAGTGANDARRFALDAHTADFTAVARLLDCHLADEEEIVVPAMLAHGERAIA